AIGSKALVADADGLPSPQGANLVGQSFAGGHCGITNQYGDDALPALERCRDLDADEGRLGAAPAPQHLHPARTDDEKQNTACRDLIVQNHDKIVARLDMALDVHEKLIFGELVGQAIKEPSARAGVIVAAVINEYAT